MSERSGDCPIRFYVDGTVLRLGKWLRMLGIDAPKLPRNLDVSPNSCILTKKTTGYKSAHHVILVPYDNIEEQLTWFARRFSDAIKWERFGTRCRNCNLELVRVSRETVRNKVPDYISQTHDDFMICPQCQKIYWKGSHVDKMRAFLNSIGFPDEAKI